MKVKALIRNGTIACFAVSCAGHAAAPDTNIELVAAGLEEHAGRPNDSAALTIYQGDTNKALRHKLLAVPALRDRYLAYIGDIAEKWLDWNRIGPLVEGYQKLIADDVARDTRKHESTENFLAGIYGVPDSAAVPSTIKGFAELRRAALLAYPEIIRTRTP